MKIAVCIKHVPVSNNVTVDPISHVLVRQSAEGMINPADLNALEIAILLKEQTDGHIMVFTMGPPEAEKSLRSALAMGCDEGCILTDRAFAGGDTIATSKVLVNGIQNMGNFDLILTGALTSDGATGQVGPMIAEYLNIPHISEVQKVEYTNNNGKIEAICKHNNDCVRISSTIPALMTVKFGSNTPRLTTLRSQRQAKTKPVSVLTNKELMMEADQIGLEGSPTVVVDSFAPKNLRHATMLTGNSNEIASKIMGLLEKAKGDH